MAFSKYVITNAGRDLLLECMATGDFQIQSLVLGSGEYSGLMTEIENVIAPVMTFSGENLDVVKRGSQLEVRAKLTNEALNQGFEWREYGVYATNGTDTVLYCYDNAGNDPVPISSASGGTAISNTIKVILTIANDAVANITFQPDPDVEIDNTVTANGENAVSGAAVYSFAGGGIPTPTPTDSGKALVVNSEGKYELGEAGAKDAVLYTAQTLTEDQKAQARANIGAGDSEVSADKITAGTFKGDVAVPATTDMATPLLRNAVLTTIDPGAGTSSELAAGTVVYVYE